MIFDLLTPTVLITIAGTLFTLGYLIINQVILRLMMMSGSAAYLAYYFTAADQPLWGAINATLIMMAANLLGLFGLYVRNAAWTVPKAHRDIYPLFQGIQPGDFRALMRHAKRYTVQKDCEVTTMGAPTTKVFFVTKGAFEAEKFNLRFKMDGPTFVGEVAHLLGRDSAATTHFPAGLEVLEWDRSNLNQTAKKDPRFKLAMEAIMSRDLANKVSFAVAPPAR